MKLSGRRNKEKKRTLFDPDDPHRFTTVAFNPVGTHLRVLDAAAKIEY